MHYSVLCKFSLPCFQFSAVDLDPRCNNKLEFWLGNQLLRGCLLHKLIGAYDASIMNFLMHLELAMNAAACLCVLSLHGC